MIAPDVNVLVAAFRADHPHHEPARRALETAQRTGEAIVLIDLVRVGFVRIVTSRRIFKTPDLVDDALTFADALVVSPFGVIDTPAPGRWERVRALCAQSGAVGELMVDAYVAAAAIDLGAAVISFDTDFARFDGVRWVRPT